MIRDTYGRLSLVLREFIACGFKTLTSKKVRLNLEPHNPFEITSSP